ncbi:hypothetical protein BS17DRAFT_815306 [Gyrodon lividus]|nr:hypothetical protein BS17DRAFT_815306 [Gyrodon lividus]
MSSASCVSHLTSLLTALPPINAAKAAVNKAFTMKDWVMWRKEWNDKMATLIVASKAGQESEIDIVIHDDCHKALQAAKDIHE